MAKIEIVPISTKRKYIVCNKPEEQTTLLQ